MKVKAKDQYEFESGWSSGLLVTIRELRPNIAIGTITGGLFGISTEITNIGEASASNVIWEISVDGDFIVTGQTISGTLPTLSINGTARIEDRPVLGFGQIAITIKVKADGIPEMTKTANGFIFFIFVTV